MTRRHVVTARPASNGETIELVGTSPGLFHARLAIGDVVRAGGVIGDLEVLGNTIELVAPDHARGAVIAVRAPTLARTPVDFGAVLLTLDPRANATDVAAAAIAPTAPGVEGLVFRAPTSGRYYARSAPDKPPFLTAGAEISSGATVCLLEVMKTFHRVTYGGAGLPEPARVRALLVTEGADVNAGDPLLALDPL